MTADTCAAEAPATERRCATSGYRDAETLLVLAHEISLSRSLTSGVSDLPSTWWAARATRPNVFSATLGNSTPYAWGQKNWHWRSAAEWMVRAWAPRTPSEASLARISPAARVVKVTARVAEG